MTIKRVSMQRLMIACCAVLLASCAAAPKTVTEFRAAMIQKPAFTKQEVHVINREFSVVVKNVERKSKECLGFGYTTTTTAGVGSRQSTVVYHPHVKVVGDGTAEMIMQMEHIPKAIGSPEGGAYVFLTDIKKMSATKTRITMYGTSFPTWEPIFSAIKGWAEGESVKCPDSP